MKLHCSAFLLVSALAASPANAAVFKVTSNATSGDGTLAQAILNANATPGADRIEFNLAPNRRTITITDDLPEITDSVVMDGTTQTGFAGTPLVTIAGTVNASAARSRLLRLSSTNSTIKALIFNNLNQNDSGGFIEPGNAIEIVGGSSNLVVGCFIGVPSSGLVDPVVQVNPARIRGSGVLITNSPGNIIGGINPGDRNVIAGCNRDGVAITGGLSIGNRVLGNYLGLDSTGTNRVSGSESGASIEDAAGNQIGGTTPEERNYIVPNFSRAGVRIVGPGASNNVVSGNWMGLRTDGTDFGKNATIPTAVAIQTNATANVIGGATEGAGNVIGGSLNGITIFSSGNKVFGNWVGLRPDGTTAATNDNSGIAVTGDHNQIGGPNPGERNIASFNRSGGISIKGNSNIVQGNWVGLDKTGRIPRPNGGGFITGSISISGLSTGNLIGGPGFNQGNVVAASTLAGIALVGVSASNNIVQGNWIGLDATGTNVMGNKGDGIVLTGARFNTIGSTLAAPVAFSRRAAARRPVARNEGPYVVDVPPGANFIAGSGAAGLGLEATFKTFGDGVEITELRVRVLGRPYPINRREHVERPVLIIEQRDPRHPPLPMRTEKSGHRKQEQKTVRLVLNPEHARELRPSLNQQPRTVPQRHDRNHIT